MFKCTCGFHTCEGSYETETDRTNHLKAVKAEKTKEEIITVTPLLDAGMSQSKIESKTGYSAETVTRCIKKIENLKKKKARRKECRECFEKGKLEHEAASITGLTPAKVKKYYNKFKKEKGLDVTTPTSPKSSDQILSINGETSFPIECKSCSKKKNQKMFVIEQTIRTQSGAMVRSFAIEAEGRCECGALHSKKIIPDDVSS